VLVHGGNMDHRVWNPQVDKFAEDYWVITYDVRGFGKSSEKDKPHQAHRDLCSLLDELKITQPVHIAGLSLGGRIAVDFTLCNPDRVRSLALVAPGLSGWKWHDADWHPILAAMQNNPDREFARKGVVETWLASPGMIPAMQQKQLQADIRKWTSENAKSELSDLMRLCRDPEEPLSPPAINRLHEINVPTLLLIGSKDSLDMLDIANRIEKRCSRISTRDVQKCRTHHYPRSSREVNSKSPQVSAWNRKMKRRPAPSRQSKMVI
jgi:3-oxoadipate enol-lactonase